MDDPFLLMDEGSTMSNPAYFENLVTSVEKIARHSYYPGIDEAVTQCLDDIDELMQSGQITLDQRDALRLVLLGITLQSASAASAA
jgi:hypothetical protein